MQGIKRKLTRGVAWTGATRVLTNLVGFASTFILARLLTPGDFGLVAIANMVSFIVVSVTNLSLDTALIQHENPTPDHFHGVWTLGVCRGLILAAIIGALAYPIAWAYSDARIVPILFVIAGATAIGSAANPKMAVFQRDLVFWQTLVTSATQSLVGFTVAVTIALVYRTYWALVLGVAANQISAVIVSYLLKPYRPRFQFSQMRELLSFSVWLSLGQAVSTLNWRFDYLIVGYVLGTTPLGYYSMGDNLAQTPTRESTTPIALTLFPGFSRINNDIARLRDAYQRSQAFLCAIALPAGFGFAVIARPLVLLAMGPKWLPCVMIVQFLSGSLALQTLSSTLQPLAMATGETRALFIRDVINFAIRIPLIVTGVVLGGFAEIVYARCVSGLSGNLINMAMARRLLGLPIGAQFAANTRALVSTTVMVAVTVAVGEVAFNGTTSAQLLHRLVALVILGAISYVATSLALWHFAGRPRGPESEILSLLRLVARDDPQAPGGI